MPPGSRRTVLGLGVCCSRPRAILLLPEPDIPLEGLLFHSLNTSPTPKGCHCTLQLVILVPNHLPVHCSKGPLLHLGCCHSSSRTLLLQRGAVIPLCNLSFQSQNTFTLPSSYHSTPGPFIPNPECFYYSQRLLLYRVNCPNMLSLFLKTIILLLGLS